VADAAGSRGGGEARGRMRGRIISDRRAGAGPRTAVRYNRRPVPRNAGRVPPLAPGFRMSYYQRHVFFCCNQREAPEACCNNHGASDLQKYAKERIKALGLNGQGKVRMNRAGCLDRCEEGPVLVVYPDAVWYTYVDRADIDEIIDRHIVDGEVVARLRI